MKVTFQIINEPLNIYTGELTETIEGDGLNAIKFRDLRIPPAEDVISKFSSLHYGQVVTLIINHQTIDFYKSVGNSEEYLLSTRP